MSQERLPEIPPAEFPLRAALTRVLASPEGEGEPDAGVIAVEDALTMLVLRDWSTLALLDLRVELRDENRVRARLLRIVRRMDSGRLHLAVLWADQLPEWVLDYAIELAQSLKNVTVSFIDADGNLLDRTGARKLSPLTTALERLRDPAIRGSMGPMDAAEGEILRRKFEAAQQKEKQLHQAVESRPSPVTWTLGITMTLMFLLSGVWGGAENPLTLWRMGANDGDLAFDEPWRLLASTFLHQGLLHIALNVWVLSMFGGILERRIRSVPYLAVYTLSAVGASAASAVLNDSAMSVGASGALFGVLAAVFVTDRKVPRIFVHDRGPPWPIVLAYLLYSFRPGVDHWAHLGGALVGVLLALAGLARPDLARAAELTAGKGNLLLRRTVAVAFTLALAGSTVGALALGRAWELRFPPPLEQLEIPGTGLSLQLPRGYEFSLSDASTALAGHPSRDPLLIEVRTGEPAVPGEGEAGAIRVLHDDVARRLREAGVEGDHVRVESIDGAPTVAVDPSVAQAHRVPRWVTLRDGRVLRLHVHLAPDASPRWQTLAEKLIHSLAGGESGTGVDPAPKVEQEKPSPIVSSPR